MTDERQATAEDVLSDGQKAQQVRQAGRAFLVNLYATLRSLSLYPVENDQVQRNLDELRSTGEAMFRIDSELEVRLAGEFIFINGTRLRLGLDNYAMLGTILTTLRQCDIGILRATRDIDRHGWQVFLSQLLTYAPRDMGPNKLSALQESLVAAGVTAIELWPPPDDEEEVGETEAKEVAKRTYGRCVAVTKQTLNDVRMGKTKSVRKVKRAVQGIVDQVMKNEASLVGLTTLRDYDDYTFTHSVNVCIFSVSIGKRIGLSKLQLYDLGLTALLHDVGKSRIPLDLLNKTGPLDDDEWRIMRAHPWLGVLTLFKLRGYGDIPYRSMIVAFEHHMKIDLTGYPKHIRPRNMSVFSKIVAVADGFDAATSRRSYQTNPIQPDQVLREMWENPRRGCDPVLVKGLINLLGIYPVGTCVILDTYEIGIVLSANADPSQLNRPVVRIVMTANGGRLNDGPVIDLAETDSPGHYKRSIIKVTDPAKYDIIPGNYFV
jgi:HD-GYP domain-containing protein (c-di-GMP phosphodiesterase class II)